MYRIFILGAGEVGSATGRAFARGGHRVTFIDTDAERVATLSAEGLDARPWIDLAGEPESFVFLCLPTTSAHTPGYDLSVLERGAEHVARALATADARHTVVIRSSVPVGTTEGVISPLLERHSGRREGIGFSLAVHPHFLRSGSMDRDARRPRLSVVGARSQRVARRLRDLLSPLGGQLRMFDQPAAAELVKCTNSVLAATKISFWNEIWEVCTRLGVDQDAVADAVASDPAGSFDPHFGTRGGAPYGGDRLPKDVEGLLGLGAELALEMPLLSAVVGVNRNFEERLAAELDALSLLECSGAPAPSDLGASSDVDQRGGPDERGVSWVIGGGRRPNSPSDRAARKTILRIPRQPPISP